MIEDSAFNVSKLKRINVVGTSGSGKSTFAYRLANILGVEYVELDNLYWKDNWVESDDEEFMAKIEAKTKNDAWVLDGNYHRTKYVKWQNIQTIIWLDYPFYLVFYRVLKRSFYRMMSSKPLWNTNNKESFCRSFFSRESIILWVITSYPQMKERYTHLFENNTKDWQLIRFTNPQQAEDFLIKIKN